MNPTRGRGAQPRKANGRDQVAAHMSEAALLDTVRQACAVLGLLAYHTHDSRRSEPGFPDLVIVGRRVLWRELKRQGKRPTHRQAAWLAALVDAGQDAGVWRPCDLLSGRVMSELRAVA